MFSIIIYSQQVREKTYLKESMTNIKELIYFINNDSTIFHDLASNIIVTNHIMVTLLLYPLIYNHYYATILP